MKNHQLEILSIDITQYPEIPLEHQKKDFPFALKDLKPLYPTLMADSIPTQDIDKITLETLDPYLLSYGKIQPKPFYMGKHSPPPCFTLLEKDAKKVEIQIQKRIGFKEGLSHHFDFCLKHSFFDICFAILNAATVTLLDPTDYLIEKLVDAAEEENLELVKFLIYECKTPCATLNFEVVPLFSACKSGNLEIVKLILDQHPDVDYSFGSTPTSLYISSQLGYMEIVKELIKRGASIEKTNPNIYTPLWISVSKGHTDISKYLIENGADIHRKFNGITILYFAIQKQRLELAMYLIERGFDVNSTNDDLQTPLHLAAERGMLELAKILVERGANAQALDGRGQTPLFLAAIKKKSEMRRYLSSKKRNSGSSN